jgi:hypothetical protein
MVVANASGSTVRADINDALQALASTSKGNSAPSTPYAGQLWLDDNTPSSSIWTMYQYDGSDWIALYNIDTTNNTINWLDYQAQNVASAGTIDLDAAYGRLVDVTGTTAITAVTLSQGRMKIVRFTGALTLTNGASLVLPGGANITTAAGDFAIFVGYASSVVRCVSYTPVAGYTAARKIVSSTRDTTTASGTQAITGAGFRPKGLSVKMAVSGDTSTRFSTGDYDGTTHSCIYYNVSAAKFGISNSYVIVAQDAAGTTQYLGAISSLDSDGATITWTKVGSPTGTIAFDITFWR